MAYANKDGLKYSAIGRAHNYDIDEIRAEIRESNVREVMTRYEVSDYTVKHWENAYGVMCKRYCRGHAQFFPYEQMAKSAGGNVKEHCIECDARRPAEDDEPLVCNIPGMAANGWMGPDRLCWLVQGREATE